MVYSMSYIRRIQKVGGSLSVNIPHRFQAEKGDLVEVDVEDDRLVVSKVRLDEYSLCEHLRDREFSDVSFSNGFVECGSCGCRYPMSAGEFRGFRMVL